jgi:cysteine desulfurase/selenocysteine lyase
MMDRREAIRTAILGIGAATTSTSLFKKLMVDETLHATVNTLNRKSDPFWQLIKSQFNFEDDILYFNHASLGSSPASVIEATETFRRTLESYPSKYMWGGWDKQVDLVRRQAAELLNTLEDEIALIHNTTEGMNVVAASMELKPGDEVIVGNHEHRTATSPWLYHQKKKGIKIVRPELPILPNSPDDIFNVYKNAITNKTRVISMVHLTNTNGMILPVNEICKLANEKGILTVIDGAQSMGAINCDMAETGCDFYTASGHKWLFSPKGIGIFYSKAERQDLLKPFIANRSYNRAGLAKIEDYNTRNLPELLGLGAALEFHKLISLDAMKERILHLRERFMQGITRDDSLKIKTPLHPALSHQILTVEKTGMGVSELKNKLFEKHKIDVRGMSAHGLNGVRISFSIYHDESDIDTIVDALKSV